MVEKEKVISQPASAQFFELVESTEACLLAEEKKVTNYTLSEKKAELYH